MNTFAFSGAGRSPGRNTLLKKMLRGAVFAGSMAFAAMPADAQTWQWVKGMSGGIQGVTGASSLSSTRTFTTGKFAASATIGSTTLTDAGNGGGFLNRLNASGDPTWTVGLTGSLFQNIYSVAASTGDAFIVGGSSGGSAVLEGKNGTSQTLSGSTCFIARYNLLGELQWYTSISSYGYIPKDIEVNYSQQKVYVTGAEGSQVRTYCYLFDGTLAWSHTATCSGSNIRSGGVAVDASGDAHILLAYKGTLTVNGINYTNANDRLFVYKMSSAGSYVTAAHIGNTSTTGTTLLANDIDADGSGNLYIGVNHSSGSLTLTGTGTSTPQTFPNSTGLNNAVIAKYNASYQRMWSNGTNGAGSESVIALCTDNSGNVFAGITNLISNSLTYDCYPPFTSTLGVADQKALALKYTTSGVLDWVAAPLTTSDGTLVDAICTYGDGSAIIAGLQTGTSTFGTVTLTHPVTGYTAKVIGLKDDISPQISGPSALCPGQAFTFNGSIAAGTIPSTHYLWRIDECDASGNPVSGGYNWELWHTGVPSGSFTFPGTSGLACNKYYRILLTAVNDDNSCVDWATATKVVYYSCNPTVNAGADITICEGTYGFVGTLFPPSGMTYAWRIGSGPVLGTASGLFVNPTSTTTYTLTGTNASGCSASDQVIVNVRPNNPAFNMTFNTSNTGYFTISASPVVTNANITQPGFGDYYSIEGMNSGGTADFNIQNPSIWWNYPSANVFKGFDHTSTTYTGIVTSLPSLPAQGRFKYNQLYRITRGTWNDNCDWRQVAYDVSIQRIGLAEPVISVVEVAEISTSRSAALTREEQPAADAVTIFPNPTTGQLNISLDTDLDAQVDVFDLFGKKIQSRTIAAGTRTLQIDLSGYTKGMYLIHVTKGTETSTHKVILQ
ncbi:MAG: T9SS type A sorting domain-containing protein [Bacteroidia bacterium]|nr:T9SS type A sorting domain-containing protein [Bacteroidia bacterium]